MSLCVHEQTVDVFPESETVCIVCGEVTSKLMSKELIIDELERGEMSIYLEDLVQNAHIYRGIIQPTLFIFHITKSVKELKNFKSKEILCYCLFNELQKNGVGRSMKEIAYFGGVESAKIWKLMKQLNNSEELDPSQLLSRVCDDSNIPYSFIPQIEIILDEMDGMTSAKPETRVAAAIALCCERKSFNFNSKDVCKSSGVKWPSVKALCRKFNCYNRYHDLL